MKYAKIAGVITSMFLGATVVMADVSVTVAPVSLVTSATAVAESDDIALFSFTLTGDDSETLESVTVTVENEDGSDASADDLDEVVVYVDDGDGSFDSEDDEAGSEADVNVGSETVITVDDNNELTGGQKFFVVLSTTSSWGDDEDDEITVTLDEIETSADSPDITTKTTAAIGVDNEGPELVSAVASKGAADEKKVTLTFDEATNKATINDSNIDDVLVLENGHTWLDGEGDITSATWNLAGTVLTIVLSDGDTAPTVAVGDDITISDDVIEDEHGNNAMGTETITGSFSQMTDEEDEDDVDEEIGNCTNGLRNGRLYKLSEGDTVYLAAACRLKPFRGAAAFHARGHKFQNITVLSSTSGITVDTKPALPAGGTLVKGSDATVYIVTKQGKRKGFVSANAFVRLGFKFDQVQQISDSDLGTMEVDTPVKDTDKHPEGTVAKCTNATVVFEIKGGKKHAFTSAEAFELRGHNFKHIAIIDCGTFTYDDGTNQTEND